MSTLSVRFPESLHKKIRELAKRDGVSINQLVTSAVAEKLSALMTMEYLEERPNRSSREKYECALSKVRDVVPEPHDEL